MVNIRDLVYVNYDEETNKVISYGIEFKEFIESLSKQPNNILVLQGYFGSNFDFTTNCEYCVANEIEEFTEEDVYSYGDFSWVDFECVDELQKLSPQEVAEILYLGKMWRAVNGTYFEKLNNRFVYNAHDDGWVNQTYYNRANDFKEVLGKVIVDKIRRIYNIDLDLMSNSVIDQLYELSIKGIAIDLLRLCLEEDNTVIIPIYQLGKIEDMDEVYSLSRESDVQVNFELVYTTKWELIEL